MRKKKSTPTPGWETKFYKDLRKVFDRYDAPLVKKTMRIAHKVMRDRLLSETPPRFDQPKLTVIPGGRA
jgi:hypothetical protein